MEYKGVEYLRKKLAQKRSRVLARYNHYDMKNVVLDFGISTPPQLRYFFNSLGWCAKSVDVVADRLVFDKFDNDIFNFNDIFNANNKDIFIDSAILSALIGSCSFVYISKENKKPILQVVDGANATGILNPLTMMLNEGYAVLERDADTNEPILEAYFTSGRTVYIDAHGEHVEDTGIDYPCLVPIINKPDAKRPFGHSRITRACMDIQASAVRTIKRSEIAAEFYSFPQKYATGLSESAEVNDKWKATMSSLLTFTKDEDGDHPIIGQFAQQSQTPHLEQLKMFASLFAGETGLTLDDLGFASSNPSSYDAIRSSHENLRLISRKAQRQFGTDLLNVGLVARSLEDGMTYDRAKLYNVVPKWLPVFESDISQIGAVGDAVMKLQQSFPNYIDE